MDKKQIAADLYRIADELRAHNPDPNAELTLWNWEESGDSEVIGTAAGFLRLAEAAIRAAADAHAGRLSAHSATVKRCLYGASAAYSSAFEGLFDLVSDPIPEKVVVMETEDARKGVARHRGRIIGDDPPTPGPISN